MKTLKLSDAQITDLRERYMTTQFEGVDDQMVDGFLEWLGELLQVDQGDIDTHERSFFEDD